MVNDKRKHRRWSCHLGLLPLTVLIIIFLQIPALMAETPRSANPSDDIRKLEDLLTLAEQHRDIAFLERYLAPEFYYIDPDGSFMNRKEFLVMVKNPDVELVKLQFSNFTFEQFGDSGLARMNYHEILKVSGKSVEQRGWTTEMWIKRNNRWQCVVTHSTALKSTAPK